MTYHSFLNAKQAAAHLQMSTKTLEKWRNQGNGPPYRKFGRTVRYRLEDLEIWAMDCVRKSTSSEDGQTGHAG